MTWKFCFRRPLSQKQFKTDLLSTIRVSTTARMVFYANVPSNLSVLREFFFYIFIPYQKHFRFPIALKLNFQILSSSRVYAVISLLFFNCRCATVVIVIFWQKLLKQTFVWNYCNCRSLSTFLVPLSCFFSFMLMPV